MLGARQQPFQAVPVSAAPRLAIAWVIQNCQACKDVPLQIQSQYTIKTHNMCKLLSQVQSNIQVKPYVCPGIGSMV